jgi:hypothetical protein
LPQWIKNNIKIFGDDTKIWKKIESKQDCLSLQKDLDTLQDWSDKWLLEFNTEKCKVMQVGHEAKYHHIGKPESRIELEITEEEKELRVFTKSDLKPSTQCLKSAAKARRIVGLIRRNFRRLQGRLPPLIQDVRKTSP